MKRLLFIITFIFVFGLISPTLSFAQSMMSFSSSSTDSSAIQSQQQEEQEGKKILDNLNVKMVTCSQLKDADFEKIGEYFMGQAIGNTSRHIAMNEMMKSMMGEKGEEQMHTVMGKRMSGCDTSAQVPQIGAGFMPMMMGMMESAFAPESFGGTKGGGNPMMGGWGGFGGLGWFSMIIFWLFLLLGVIALVKWLASSGRKDTSKKPLEILKERYAKGEIDKKEFEEKKKDLGNTA